jgi:two-component system NtrC family response regulator
VRELANVIEHAMILSGRLPIDAEHLPSRLVVRKFRQPGSTSSAASRVQTLREAEMQLIYEALDRHGGNKPQAAEALGISLKTLYNKLNQAAGLEKSA